jgi:hypothetical protein
VLPFDPLAVIALKKNGRWFKAVEVDANKFPPHYFIGLF